MSDRDPTLDLALRLLQNDVAADDDARWAKRVAAGISTWSAKSVSRAEIDALVAPPLPDDYRDLAVNEEHLQADDLEDADAAHAVHDGGDDHATPGWDSISQHPPASGRSSIDGLARLTRSGPNPTAGSLSAGALMSSGSSGAVDIGAAKADDSGLIDLRGLNASGEQPAAAQPAAESSAPVAAVVPSNVTPITQGTSKPPVASAPPAAMASVPPAMPLVAKPVAAEKKKGGAVWIVGGGLVAAAAAAFLFVNMSGTKAPETSSAPASDKQAVAKADETVSAAASVAAPKPTAEPVATEAVASASASTAPIDDVPDPTPDPTVALNTAVSPKKAPGATGSPYGTVAPPATATATATSTAAAKPTAKPSAEPTTAKPPPTGGSLDDVLGINKPGPTTTATAVSPDLPDKPESVDIRVAVNGKVPAANACVAGLDGASSVSIAFGPAGNVTGVTVTSGPAKGTGAEACIKSAFSSAKVGRSKLGGTGFAKLGSAGSK